MGWTILYIAFGLVAVWLLAEVLLQNKARLRWRLLAFVGFLGVVVGVLLPQVIVIGVGVVAFAVGQTNVTLSFRRGFTTGWALRTKTAEKGRRRARSGAAPAVEPALQVSDLEAGPVTDDPARDEDDDNVFAGAHAFQGQDGYADRSGYAGQDAAYGAQGSYGESPYDPAGSYEAAGPYGGQEAYAYGGQGPYGDGSGYAASAENTYAGQNSASDATVYAPQPMPDETGQYGIYSPDARTGQQQPGYSDYPGYDPYGTAPGADGGGNGYGYGGGYDQGAPGQNAYADAYADPYAAYGDGTDQGRAAAYSDPYIGAQQYGASYDPYEQPDPYGQVPYTAGQYDGQDQNPAQGYSPPGGSWVPQQRDGELPPEQQPYPPYQQGYDEQHYRY